MPFYDYQCRKCLHEFSELRPIAERDKAACPQCASKEVERKLSAPFIGSSSSFGAPPNIPPCGMPGGDCGSCGY